ncbi:hypothetical protein, partial [Streptomyces sp. CB02056]|uniref:hypothetical protein n=1 Tax=Streptomyces sp. CB02056 TaxID=1703924 RepID=UPI0018E9602E
MVLVVVLGGRLAVPSEPPGAAPRCRALALAVVLVGRQAVLLGPARPLPGLPAAGPWPPVQAAVLAVPAPGCSAVSGPVLAAVLVRCS